MVVGTMHIRGAVPCMCIRVLGEPQTHPDSSAAVRPIATAAITRGACIHQEEAIVVSATTK